MIPRLVVDGEVVVLDIYSKLLPSDEWTGGVRCVEEGIDCKICLSFGRENVGIWGMLNCLGVRQGRSAKDENFIVSGEQGHGQFLRHAVVLQRHLDSPEVGRRRFCGLS
ncbi:hypothetical protein BT69DRAFT_1291175 [Atractiella rhizophila]|nr:hypothetical protein BT69DRAFT_1291175 [Atractiella rhizophila]